MTVVNYSFPMFGMKPVASSSIKAQPPFQGACGVQATDSIQFGALPQGGFLRGKTAFITGSSSGIGYAIAEQMASEGAHIVMHGVEPLDKVMTDDGKTVADLKKALETQYGVKVDYIQAGMGTDADLQALVGKVNAVTGGKVDVLVNNAGFQRTHAFEQFPLGEFDAMTSVLYRANVVLGQAFAPGMKQRGWGRVINVASAHGLTASANKTAYVGAKHAVMGLTKVMGIEYANTGVTVNAIAPGYVGTPLAVRQVEDRMKPMAQGGKGMTEAEAKADLMDKQARKEFATPEEVGQLALYLASDAAKSFVGQIVSIDNGWTAGGH